MYFLIFMKLKETKKRILFQVSYDLHSMLVKYASKRGVTTSHQLRLWILSAQTIKLEVPIDSSVKKTTFNFWCDYETLSVIESLLRKYKISKSLLLRLIIINNLKYTDNANLTKKSYSGVNLMKLWENGSYNMFSNYFDGDLERLSHDQLYDYAKINTDLSHYSTALEALWVINKIHTGTQCRSYVDNSLYSNIQLNIRNITKVYSSNKVVQKPSNQESALHLITIGSLQALTNNNDNFVKTFELANNYYIENNYSLEIIKTCVLLSFGYSRECQIDKITNCFKIADQQVNKMSNLNYLGWIDAAKARFHYSQSNFECAIDFVTSGINNHKGYNMSKGLSEAHGIKAAIHISQSRYQDAYTDILKSQRYEREFRKDNSDGLTNCLKLFIESKHNFTNVIDRLSLISNQKQDIKSDIKKYLYASAFYLHSNNQEDTNKGRFKLLALKKKTNKFMQNAISNTISKKALSPFIV